MPSLRAFPIQGRSLALPTPFIEVYVAIECIARAVDQVDETDEHPEEDRDEVVGDVSAVKSPPRRRGAPPATPLRSKAYDLIKDRIITLTYAPGQSLNEAQISDHLQIGRTPVHMAIMRLAQEGLIEIAPRKGVRVAPLSLTVVQAINEARLLNEPAAARFAAERGTDEQLRAVRDLAAASSQPDVSATLLTEIDRLFHASIATAAQNDVLRGLLAGLHDQARRLFHVAWNFESGLDTDVLAEHLDIVTAIERRDGQRAERAMKEHLRSAARAIETILTRTLPDHI